MSEYSAVKQLVSRVISFPPSFARIGGSVTAGIFLAQLGYWTPRADVDGWVFKTQEQWEAETTLTRREQETARRNLRSIGVLEEKRQGIPPKSYYRINIPRLCELLAGLECPNPPERMAESAKMNGGNVQSSIPKITSEITSEITDIPSAKISPEDLGESWNEVAAHFGLPKVAGFDPDRRQKTLRRLKEHPEPEFWRQVLKNVLSSGFLNGTAPRGAGHENWVCTFDFVIRRATFIFEGGYNGQRAKPPQQYLGR